MADVAAAFVVVFFAELGDKTQLVALALAGRYRAVEVLGVLGATILVLQTLSVTAGTIVGDLVPERAIATAAGLLFLAFGVWTWRSADGADEDDGGAGRGSLAHVAGAFFVAVLGVNTLLTTAGLAADRGAVPVWLGSTAAFLAATALAVTGGRALAARVRPALVRRAGAIAFVVVGAATLASAAAR